MPSESAAQRYNVREGVRPFYPVELVLKKAINTIRNRYLLPVDQALVQTMAQEIYDLLRTRLGPLSFEKPRFTNGWMANFKDVWGYQHHEMKGEAASVDMAEVMLQLEQVKPVLLRFALKDIFNCDETGLFPQTLSNWTLDYLQKNPGLKQSSTRLSILFSVNALGTEKMRPFILSKLMELP